MHRDVDINESRDKKKPEKIQFYNATKGGIDTAEEWSSLYSTAWKTNWCPMVVTYCVERRTDNFSISSNVKKKVFLAIYK